MAVAFFDGKGKSDSCYPENNLSGYNTEISSYYNDCSAAHSNLLLPRQISSANALRLNGTTKRSNAVHKNSSEFLKAGKSVNPCIKYFEQDKLRYTCTSLIRPGYRLIAFCTLII